MKIVNSIVVSSLFMGAVFLFTAAAAAPADDTDKKTTSSAPKGALTIPPDAVPEPGGYLFTWTDKDGKKWIYRKTPFGVMRKAAADETATTKSDSGSAQPGSSKTASGASGSTNAAYVRAIDKGDTVSFERTTPFGPVRWEKKKSELTDNERRILENQNAKTEQK